MEALMKKLKKMRVEGLIRSRQKALERSERQKEKQLLWKQKRAALNEGISRILSKEETKKMLGGRYLTVDLEQCAAGYERTFNKEHNIPEVKNGSNFPEMMEVAAENSFVIGPSGAKKSMIDICNLATKIILEKCDSPSVKSRSLKYEEANAESDSQVCSQSVKVLLERCDSPVVKNRSPKKVIKATERIEIETRSPIFHQKSNSSETALNNNILKMSNSSKRGTRVTRALRGSSRKLRKLPTTTKFDDNGCENNPQLDFCKLSSSSSDSSFNEETNGKFFDTFQPKQKVLSNFNGLKLANISVVLDDLFSKNSSESSEIKVFRDKSFPCIYSKGAFKLVSEKQISEVGMISRKSKGTNEGKREKLCDKLFSSISTSRKHSSKIFSRKRQPFKPLETSPVRKVMPNRQHASRFRISNLKQPY